MAFKPLLHLTGYIFINSMLFNVLAWNVRGVMYSAFTISKMLDFYDIDFAVVSEHKLLPQSKGFLDSINTNYASYAKTDAALDPYSSFSRGKSGIGILFKKSLNPFIHHIDDMESDRLLVIEVKVRHLTPLYIISAYMPADNNLSYYDDTLSELQTCIEFYSRIGKIIVAGDLNAQISWPSCNAPISGSIYKFRVLSEMVHNYHLVPLELTALCTGPRYSFIPTRSMIDHILVDRSLENNVTDFHVIDGNEFVLTSDHLPLIATFNLREATSTNVNFCSENSQRNDMIAWRKITSDAITQYQSHIETACRDLPSDGLCADELANRITHVLHTAAKKSLPHNKYNKHLKPYWTDNVKEAHRIARFKRRLRITEGRPRGSNHTSYTEYKLAKARFQKLQRIESNAYMERVHNDLDEAAGLDYRLFWRILRSRKRKTKTFCNTLIVDDTCYESPEDVSSGFRKFYENYFTTISRVEHEL